MPPKTTETIALTVSDSPAPDTIVDKTASEGKAKKAKKKTSSTRDIRRGVQRPYRRLTEPMLRFRRVEYRRRLTRHQGSVTRTGGILAKYDAEFMHRGLEEEAAPDQVTGEGSVIS